MEGAQTSIVPGWDQLLEWGLSRHEYGNLGLAVGYCIFQVVVDGSARPFDSYLSNCSPRPLLSTLSSNLQEQNSYQSCYVNKSRKKKVRNSDSRLTH
jgi:hypothetical protein